MTELDELKSENAILKESNRFLQELYYAEKDKVKKARQKCIKLAKALQTAKTEARKEFAEELRSKARKYTEYDEGGWDRDVYAVEVAEIDNLLEEMESKS